MAARKAASVLPLPVGAAISTWLPAWIAGHASACAGVGAAKVWRNQRATAGWKGLRWLMIPIPRGPPALERKCCPAPTIWDCGRGMQCEQPASYTSLAPAAWREPSPLRRGLRGRRRAGLSRTAARQHEERRVSLDPAAAHGDGVGVDATGGGAGAGIVQIARMAQDKSRQAVGGNDAVRI